MKYLPIILGIMLMSLPGVMALTPDGSTAITPGDFTASLIILLFIVATILLFYTLFLTIAKLVTADETVYDVLLAWGSFILLIIVNHLTAHYLEDVYIYNLTETFISITPWTNVVLPLVAFIITLFIKSTQKKRPMSVQEIGGFRRG
jgi:hypothetical protein